MMEGSPQTPEEIRRLNRDLMEKIIDKAASDPEWKQRLLDDPEAVMAEAGFPEAERLREMQGSVRAAEEAEVVGQQGRDVCFRPFTGACNYTSSNPIVV
jgi:hypothetical protein